MTNSGPSRVEFSTIRTRNLGATDRATIVRLCVAAHGEPDFENLFSYLPRDGLHLLAKRGDELVGHAVVTTRWLQAGTRQLLRTAYIDAVSVAPDSQRLGIGSALMQHLATEITGYQIACLQTDQPRFYEQSGWEEWSGPLGGRSEGGVIPTPDQKGIMILRLPSTPDLDMTGQLTIEETRFRIW